MMFIADTKEFRTALQIAGRVIQSKSPWPVLECLKIVTNDNRITVIGSDANTTFEADLSAEVQTEGVACIPFGTLQKFIASAKADQCKVAVEDRAAKISAGRSRIALGVWPESDYPNYRPADGDPISLDRDTFCAALRFALAAATDDEVRYSIAGPNFSEGADGISVWGTDGSSAHLAKISGVTQIGGGGTVPRPGAHVALSVAEKAESVAFMVCNRGWHLATPNVRVWGKVIDAAFLDMERMVASFPEWSDIAVAPRSHVSDAVNLATCGAAIDAKKSRSLILRAEQGQPIVLRGKSADSGVIHAGRAEVEVEAKADFAGPVVAKYLASALAGIDGDDVVIEGAYWPDSTMGRAIRIKPAQQSATLEMMAMISALRASEAEVADV